MSLPLYLFCGGPAHSSEGLPKPLMKIRKDRTLLVHFLKYLQKYRRSMPEYIMLLCDDGQEVAIQSELSGLSYPVAIGVQACGKNSNTFEKLSLALGRSADSTKPVQFGYPDIFSFGEHSYPPLMELQSESSVYISAAALTSRFPRLIVNLYNNTVKGISNYNSAVPANPLYVFGGDLWGRIDQLRSLVEKYRSQVSPLSPSLEYDFFFWLINNNEMRCVMLRSERIWVDSVRDINRLLLRTADI